MRLEYHHQPPIDAGACRRQHRRNLGRVMPIVVDDHHAVFFAKPLESPFGTLELGQCRRDRFERDANLETHGHCSQRIEQVVAAWHLQPQFAEFDFLVPRTFRSPVAHDRARPERLERHPVRRHARRRPAIGRRETVGQKTTRDPRQHGPDRLIVRAGDHGAVERDLVRELDKGLLEVRPAAVALHVLVVDVRNHGDRRRQLQK